jgi:hypothetical protein
MTSLTTAQEQAIRQLVEKKTLSAGLGTTQSPCSIAAINLALTGKLTDKIPDCMSRVIGAWIIWCQDEMPGKIRNSAEWKALLPLAAGTGREHERQRLDVLLDWMWGTVLPVTQPAADQYGFGDEWRAMLIKRSKPAAAAAANAAANAATYDAYASAAYASAAYAARAAVAYAATYDAAAYAARAAAAYAATNSDYWQQFNPCGLLKQLIEVSIDD